MPQTNGARKSGGMPPSPCTSNHLNSSAPAVIGRLMRNANRAAPSRPSPTKRPTVIVTPERDTPGCRAMAWPTPMTRASVRLTSSIVRLPRAPSARASSRPPTMSITAISQIWSVFSSIESANSPPDDRGGHRRHEHQPPQAAVLRLAAG